MSKELVADLLRGSEELNRMQQEIRTVVNIAEGLVRKLPLKDHFTNADNGGIWITKSWGRGDDRWSIKEKKSFTFEVEFTKTDTKHRPRYTSEECLWSPRGGSRPEDIKYVHDRLPDLVEGLLKQFPQLLQHMHPYLQAANNRQ